MNRRSFLTCAGAAAVAAADAEVWYTFRDGVLAADEESPYAAWHQSTTAGEPGAVKLVRSAILAASPHNTQPWRFRVAQTFVELYLEASRSVPGLDPYLREAHIGMGCALENLVLAAAANGYAVKVTLTEGKLDGQHAGPPMRLVARVDLAPGVPGHSEFYDAIPRRHTNRSVFDAARELPAGFADELLAVCSGDTDTRMFLFTSDAQRGALARISASANLDLYSDPKVENGSEQWIRWRAADVRKFKDGLTIDNFGLSPFATSIAKLLPTSLLKQAAAPNRRSRLYETQMKSARLIGIISVRDRMDQRMSLEAGRIWQRAHLLATARGVGARPSNEAIETIDHERSLGLPAKRQRELAEVTRDSAWQPTFLFTMGYSTLPAHLSPRRPVESVELPA